MAWICRWLLAALFFLVAGPSRAGGSEGDSEPLPRGARARLGTGRLRHDRPALLVAFVRDGKALLSVGEDQFIRFWDPATGDSTGNVSLRTAGEDIHANDSAALLLSADGKTLVVGGIKGTVRFLDVATGAEQRVLRTPPGLRNLALSPDGQILVTAHSDGALRAWDVAARNERRWETGEVRGGPGLAFSPDGKCVAVGGKGGSLRLVEVASGRTVRSLAAPASAKEEARPSFAFASRLPLAFSPDGKLLAGAAGERMLDVWEVQTGKRVLQLRAGEDTPWGTVWSLAFAPNGRFLAAGCRDRAIHIWGLASGKEMRLLEGHAGAVRAVAFSPDGKLLASCAQERRIHLWDLSRARPLHASDGHDGAVQALIFLPDGRQLVSSGTDGTVRLWDVATGVQRQQLDELPSAVTCLAAPYPGTTVLSMAFQGGIHAWSAGRGREVRWTGLSFAGSVPMVFTPDGKTLVLVVGKVQLRDTATGRLVRDLPLESRAWISRLTVSPDSRLLAAASDKERMVWLWDLVTAKEIRRLKLGPGEWPVRMTFAPDGRALACWDGKLRLFEIATGAERAVFRRVEGIVTALAFSADGRLLAVASGATRDGSVYVVDTATGQPLIERQGHHGQVTALAFAPDGKTLASGGHDTTILLWDLAEIAARRPAADPAPEKLQALWTDLLDEDAARAYLAVRALAAAPGRSVPFLRERLRQGPPRSEELVRLIGELDNDRSEVREHANQELAALGAITEPALKKALRSAPSAEVSQRLNLLLDRIKAGGLPADRLRPLRAVEALEQTGTAEARQVLEELGRGEPAAPLTQEAKAALERLARRLR